MNRCFSVFGYILLFLSPYLQASSGFVVSGLQDMEMQWNGTSSNPYSTQTFCVQLDGSTGSVPSQLHTSDINYTLELLSYRYSVFQAASTSTGSKIPLDIKLSTRESSFSLQPGQTTGRMSGSTQCSNMTLRVSAVGDMAQFPSGEYRAQMSIALNNDFGDHDTKDFSVTISIPKLIGIKGDSEIQLEAFNGTNSPKGEASLCVFRNGAENYKLKAEGNGQNSAFQLTNTTRLDALPLDYNVRIRTPLKQEPILPNHFLQNLKGSAQRNCADAGNVTVAVDVPRAWAENARAGLYRGQLKITVEVQ